MTVNTRICMLQITGSITVMVDSLYSGVASLAAQQRLNVYQFLWLRCLMFILGWVCISFVPQSVIDVTVMYACKMIPTVNSSSFITCS
jgi:hypothetical protein